MNDALNPYSPPQSNVAVADSARELVDASRWRRFGTFAIDYILFLVISFCVGAATVILFGEAGIRALQSVPDLVLGLIILVAYYVFFEGIWARTPGKFLCGTVVVSQSGERASFGQVVGRTLCRLIPFEALSFFSESGLHDTIPKTRVVMAR